MKSIYSVLLLYCLLVGSLYGKEVEIVTVSVGVAKQAAPKLPAPGYSAKGTFADAAYSAETVAEYFAYRNSAGGILLDGREMLVSRDDVFSALDRGIEKAKALENPFLVFYFAGHGLSEGIAWNLYCVPGTFVGPEPLRDQEQAGRLMIHAAEVVAILNESEVPYCAFFDNCNEGKEEIFKNTLLEPTAEESLRSVADVLRFMNRFENPDPVIFSTTPGNYVNSVKDPREPSRAIGPLARRLVLAFRQLGNGSFTLPRLVDLMTLPNLDSATETPVSHVKQCRPIVISANGTRTSYDKTQGTATGPIIPADLLELPEMISEEISSPTELRLVVSGAAGDFITDGEDFVITAKPGEVFMITRSPDDLDLTIISKDMASVSISAPSGRSFQKGAAGKATRYGFAEGTWGLSVGIGSNGCNESTGSVEITEAVIEGDQLKYLEFYFKQSCDEGPEISGSVSVRW